MVLNNSTPSLVTQKDPGGSRVTSLPFRHLFFCKQFLWVGWATKSHKRIAELTQWTKVTSLPFGLTFIVIRAPRRGNITWTGKGLRNSRVTSKGHIHALRSNLDFQTTPEKMQPSLVTQAGLRSFPNHLWSQPCHWANLDFQIISDERQCSLVTQKDWSSRNN